MKSKTVVEDITPIEIDDDDPQVVTELGELRESISVKNYREYYHDALEHREELFTLFNLGLVSLEDRAKGEVLFWDVCERADKYAQTSEIRFRRIRGSATPSMRQVLDQLFRISLVTGQLGARPTVSHCSYSLAQQAAHRVQHPVRYNLRFRRHCR